MSQGEGLQAEQDCLSSCALDGFVYVFGQSEDGRIVNFWHFVEECCELFLVLWQRGTETDLSLSVQR